ncbi:MAG: TonB family protein [Terriglobia bacterium]
MSTQTPIDLWREKQSPSVEIPIHLLVELDPEIAIWRRRALFLTSVFLHIFLIMFLIYAPDLLRRGKLMMGIPVAARPERQITTLFIPPDLLKSLREPPPEARPSDKNRRAQGRSPVIDPNGLKMPYSRGNTPEPEIAHGAQPSPPPAAAPTPPPPAPPAPKPDAQAEARLRLEDVTPPDADGAGRFRVPSLTPGQAIQQSMQAAARGGYHPESGSGGGGDSNMEFNNLHPNFSTEAPTILSDTRGVDFGPYLARIIFIVRRNWLSVIPESARLGEKGRVAIVFEILKDGSMPQERMVASSGSDPLDRAAYNGIHASVPFPPLPQEFTGNHLVLQFIFLYNLTPEQ